MKDSVIGIIGVCAGALITGIMNIAIAFINNKKDEKRLFNERQKATVRNLYDQIASFYNLEKLYINEIIDLRKKNGKEYTEAGIMNEFREKIYSDNNERITLNASSALANRKNFE